jgi:hypothetical protein
MPSGALTSIARTNAGTRTAARRRALPFRHAYSMPTRRAPHTRGVPDTRGPLSFGGRLGARGSSRLSAANHHSELPGRRPPPKGTLAPTDLRHHSKQRKRVHIAPVFRPHHRRIPPDIRRSDLHAASPTKRGRRQASPPPPPPPSPSPSPSESRPASASSSSARCASSGPPLSACRGHPSARVGATWWAAPPASAACRPSACQARAPAPVSAHAGSCCQTRAARSPW